MANFPCQDCKLYMSKYNTSNGTPKLRRTCAAQGIYCVHQNSAVPCKRTNCQYWKHENSVNGIAWCDKCQQGFDHLHDYDVTLTCKACMVPDAFVLYNDDELEFVLSHEDCD